MSKIATLAWLTFEEARRRRTVLAALGLGAVFLLVFTLGVTGIRKELTGENLPEAQVRFGYGFLFLAGFYVVHFLTVMLTIFSSAGTLSTEISSHTIQALVTKPVDRAEIVLGKWLGHAAMLVLYMSLLAGGILLAMRVLTGYTGPRVADALLLLALEIFVLLSLSLLGGTRLSTTANGVMLFLLYGLAFIGAWVGQIGALLQSPSTVRIGTITGYLLPVEALWRRAAFLMQPPLPVFLPATPFTGGAAPGGRVVLYAALYTAVVLALAVRSFGRRDL